MATFKVGDRVRVIGIDDVRARKVLGATGTVRTLPLGAWTAYEYAVDLDDFSPDAFGAVCWGFHGHQLTPLTDPKADAFVESLKKLAREPQSKEKEAA